MRKGSVVWSDSLYVLTVYLCFRRLVVGRYLRATEDVRCELEDVRELQLTTSNYQLPPAFDLAVALLKQNTPWARIALQTPTRDRPMLRTIFTIGILALVGLFVLRLVFGILGGVFSIIFALLGLAIPVLIIGSIIYVVMLVFAPETARDWRQKFGGS